MIFINFLPKTQKSLKNIWKFESFFLNFAPSKIKKALKAKILNKQISIH
jgi:hypothetical protein